MLNAKKNSNVHNCLYSIKLFLLENSEMTTNCACDMLVQGHQLFVFLLTIGGFKGGVAVHYPPLSEIRGGVPPLDFYKSFLI